VDITDKVAVVTGAATGIGRATAFALAEAGARAVCLGDIDAEAAEITRAGVEERGAAALTIRTDVSKASDIKALFDGAVERFGPLDIVHNNAGVVSGDPPWPDMSLERIEQVVAINLLGIAYGTRLAVDHLRGRGGVVVNTASLAGLGRPMPTDPMYAATKSAVVVLSKSCAPLMASHGIRVNCVLPGITDTPILNKTGDGVRPAAWFDPALDAVVMLRPEDIASAVLEIIRDDTKAGEAVMVANQMR
jgi:NAD(P)-dependent dehydrogenase (short-subunit alcohol dehydrogenase family)